MLFVDAFVYCIVIFLAKRATKRHYSSKLANTTTSTLQYCRLLDFLYPPTEPRVGGVKKKILLDPLAGFVMVTTTPLVVGWGG
jgi:hypothetical protein